MGRVIQSEVDTSLNHVVVVWFVPISCPEFAICHSAHFHGFYTVMTLPYVYPLHRKGLKHFIHTDKGSVIQSEVDSSLNHVVVVWFVPISCPEFAICHSAHFHGFYTVRMHPYVHPLHGKGLKHFIHTDKGSVIQSEVDSRSQP